MGRRVFVSSATSPTLASYRRAAIEVCHRLGLTPVHMEEFDPQRPPPLQVCRDMVDSSDIFVLILAHRYGSRPTGADKSYTELEYDQAVKRPEVSILAFVIDSDLVWPPNEVDRGLDGEALDRFVDLVRSRHLIRRLRDVAAFREDLFLALSAEERRPTGQELATRTIRRPWMAPPLDPGMVARDEVSTQLLELVLGPTPGPVGVSGVHGAGGFGKTTLAVWLCHQQRVRQAFPGGLLWVTLGEQVTDSDLAARINSIVQQLTDDRPTFTDAMQAGFRLGDVLDQQSDPILLVIDDVWTAYQLEPFRCGGHRCRRLVTTRQRWLLPPEASVRVDEMTDSEAAELLTRNVRDAPDRLVIEVLSATRRWPVLLGLANRTVVRSVRYGTPVARALTDINDRLRERGPTAFDIDNREHRGRLVAATVLVGLDLLPPATTDRFRELAIFGEDVNIPLPVLQLLWGSTGGLSGRQVRRACEALADLSLVVDYDAADQGTIRLHDVIRAYLIHATPPDQLADWHGALLDSAAVYTTATQDPSWWTLPSKLDYFNWHLVEHLYHAGRHAELASTVTDLRWVERRLRSSGPAGVEADLGHTQTEAASALAQFVRQQSHLLGLVDPPHSLGAILASRLDGTVSIESQLVSYRSGLSRPRLDNRWIPPDRAHPALMRVLNGHSARVSSAGASADGTSLVSASRDATVRVWDPATGACRQVLVGHAGPVHGVAISDHGSWLASAGHDQTVRVWDPKKGTCRHVLTGHMGPVSVVTSSPRGTWLFSASDDATLRKWDPITGTCQQVFVGHRGPVYAVALASDGRWLVSASDDATLRIWDPLTGECRHTLTGHTGPVYAMALAPDCSWLVSGGYDATVRVWDPKSGTCTRTLTGHAGWVSSVVASPDGSWIASASDDGTVRVWDSVSGRGIHNLTPHAGCVSAVAVAANGSWLASADGRGTVRIWDPVTGAIRNTLTGHSGWIYALKPTGQMLASAGDDGMVRVWNPAANGDQPTVIGHSGPVSAATMFAEGALMATSSIDGTVRTWDLNTGAGEQVLSNHPGPVTAVTAVAQTSWLAGAGDDGTVRVWNVRTGSVERTMAGHRGPVSAMVALDHTRLASSSDDGTVRIWNVAADRCEHILVGHNDRVATIAAATDGTWLASAGDDGVVRVWDPYTGLCRLTLKGHRGRMSALTEASGGTWLISGGHDGTVRVWDCSTGACQYTLTRHAGRVSAIASARNRTWLATADDRGSLLIWDPDTGTCRYALSGHAGKITAVVSDPDGAFIASVGVDATLRIWDPILGRCIALMRVDSGLTVCDWLPDGSAIIVAGASGVVYGFDFVRDSGISGESNNAGVFAG